MDTMNCSLAMALSERVDWMGTYGLVITSCVKLRKERVSSARPHVFMQAICATFEVDFSLSCSQWTCRLCCSRASSTFGLAVTAKPQMTTSALPPRSRVPSTMACIFHYQYRLLSPDNHSWSRQANRAGRNGAHQLRNRSNQSPSRHISKSASPSIPPSLKPTQYPLPVT